MENDFTATVKHPLLAAARRRSTAPTCNQLDRPRARACTMPTLQRLPRWDSMPTIGLLSTLLIGAVVQSSTTSPFGTRGSGVTCCQARRACLWRHLALLVLCESSCAWTNSCDVFCAAVWRCVVCKQGTDAIMAHGKGAYDLGFEHKNTYDLGAAADAYDLEAPAAAGENSACDLGSTNTCVVPVCRSLFAAARTGGPFALNHSPHARVPSVLGDEANEPQGWFQPAHCQPRPASRTTARRAESRPLRRILTTTSPTPTQPKVGPTASCPAPHAVRGPCVGICRRRRRLVYDTMCPRWHVVKATKFQHCVGS